MTPAMTTIPPEVLERILQHVASPRTPNPPLARRPTIGDRRIGDVSRNGSASASLSALSQTCKYLRAQCLPYIFCTMTVGSSDSLQKLEKILSYPGDPVGVAQKNANSLAISIKFRLLKDIGYDQNNKHIKQLRSIARCCVSLTALHLTNILFNRDVVKVLTQMKALRSLSLEVVFSGTKAKRIQNSNILCREYSDNDEWPEFANLPPLESLHLSPPIFGYSYNFLAGFVWKSLKELSIHKNTACLGWAHRKLLYSALSVFLGGGRPRHFPRLERIFFQRLYTTLNSLDIAGPIIPFLRRNRETLREINILPRFFDAPNISYAISFLRYMAGEEVEDVDPIASESSNGKNCLYVSGICALFGEWSAPIIEEGQRSVLELGLSFDPPRSGQEEIVFDFPMLKLGTLLDSGCFDEIELIALDSIYKHEFFFSDLLHHLESICTTRFTRLRDISISWDARYTRWSQSEPRLFTELSTSAQGAVIDLNEEWTSANYAIAVDLIGNLFRHTSIERLELVPVLLDLKHGFIDRNPNSLPFASWVWRKFDSEVRGTLWKRSKQAPFVAVGLGAERETEINWPRPVVDEEESDEEGFDEE